MKSQAPIGMRTYVMTGASRGIGKVAAARLLTASPGVHLVIVARSGAATLARELGESTNHPHVSGATADLSSLESIRAAAREIKRGLDSQALPPLAGFIGNAGLQYLSASNRSADGIEMTFAVNVLANYVFVEELREHFTAPARIVLTTSDTHFGDLKHNMGMVPAPKWQDPAGLATPVTTRDADGAAAGRTAYSTSKLGLIYLTHALARRLPDGVDVFSFNPGLVPGTGLVRESGAITRFLFSRVMPVMTLTPYARSLKVSGADLAAAALDPISAESGAYINGAKVEASSPESYNPDREDALWNELARVSDQKPLTADLSVAKQ
ncbi:MAG: SDR family NAD(P)-dependent oxidoreductase [Solirubrobacterales bacterium]|nr:SDR family NAD(P)-dependent oxidoreductase [Solirubrobacterales bacterium]